MVNNYQAVKIFDTGNPVRTSEPADSGATPAGRAIRVAMLDDDIRYGGKYYVESLQNRGFEVQPFWSTDKFMAFFRQDGHADLVILDVMMPPGRSLRTEQTRDGQLTGLVVARELRKLREQIPIVFLSSTPSAPYAEMAKGFSNTLVPCAFLEKSRTPAADLPNILAWYFKTGKIQRGLFRRIVDSLMLEPNIAGWGIDLKKLVRPD